MHVTPTFIPPYLLPIGEVAITYRAVDKSGNEASCTFSVKVIGKFTGKESVMVGIFLFCAQRDYESG